MGMEGIQMFLPHGKRSYRGRAMLIQKIRKYITPVCINQALSRVNSGHFSMALMKHPSRKWICNT
jgi:hypothetical protein